MDPTTERLLADVEAGLRVLQTRDGLRLDEAQIRERARNIVMGLVGNFRIESLDAADEEARRAEREGDAGDSASPGQGG